MSLHLFCKSLKSAGRFTTLGIATAVLAFAAEAPADDRIDFSRDVRRILSDNCFQCHGPDRNQRQSGLRLDVGEVAKSKLESGETAIVPGNRAKSEMWNRIKSKEDGIQMPPADSGKQLTQKQIEILGKWIDQGAQYQQHWALIPPKRPEMPAVKQTDWVRNSIDRFVLARLEKDGLTPSQQADRTTLIRRVTFDLTGLPPTIAEVEAYLKDESPDAYEKVVDRLLRSPHYGEHRARFWLDAARYGDTHGLHLDNRREIWPYRDWVISSFNANQPFDQFAVEQIAGDLLPDPTLDQKVATGFNRCNVTTSEGGAIAEEFRVRYAVDRAETLGTVFMGMTVGCAVCHDHKFDPISHQDFFQLFAYYANTQDRAMDGNALLPPPAVQVPTAEQRLKQREYDRRIAELQREIQRQLASVKYVEPKQPGDVPKPKPQEVVWVDDELPDGAVPSGNDGANSWKWITADAGPVFSGKRSATRTGTSTTQHYFTEAKPGLTIREGDKLFAYVYLDPKNPPKSVMLQFNDGSWEHRAYWGGNQIPFGQNRTPGKRPMGKLPETGKWTRLEVDAQHVGLKPGAVVNGFAFTQFDGTVHWDKAGVVTTDVPSQFESQLAWEAAQQAVKTSTLPKPVQDALKIESEKRNDAQKKVLRDHFLEHVCTSTRPVFDPLHKQLAEVNKQKQELEKTIPSTLVIQEKPGKRPPVYVLARGEYDKPDKSQPVQPGIPVAFGTLPDDAPKNRLGLAKWITASDNPLTARVTVNRFWQQYFGLGLVKTSEDFGAQGESPSHPELLDWLARDFVDGGWNVKRLHKTIVMSATYRQSSKVSRDLVKLDPENRLLARGPRFRLDAEMIRDNALAVSGLLVRKVGGPSVKPYQPKGLWEAVGYTDSNTANFTQDHGDKLFRRSMYTFWKRTAPPPTMSTFDAPSREACTVRRERTNTPLQALALMNDKQFVEASRKFAERIMLEGGKTTEERIAFAFRSCTARKPTAEERAVIKDLFESHLAEYRADEAAALKLLSVGESSRNETLAPAELAAWTLIANLVLNLDEAITKG